MEAIQTRNPNLNSIKRVSYRDPAGSVYVSGDLILRKTNENAAQTLQQLLELKAIQHWMNEGKLIETEQVSPTEFTHPRVFFPTYPFEWCPEMLYASAEHTLEFVSGLLGEGYGLKDASARNLLFEGSKTIFVDLLSFEKRHPNDATWLPFEQFLKNFIYPLALHRARRCSIRSYFLSARDGWTPIEVKEAMGLVAFSPRYFALVVVPYYLSRWVMKHGKKAPSTARFTSTKAESRFILKILFKHLWRGLERVRPVHSPRSFWTHYDNGKSPYGTAGNTQKSEFVEKALLRLSPRSVLDLGCNKGRFSLLAARQGARVVALDSDVNCISSLWKQALETDADILPLCMELNEPSPALGWNHSETFSFAERAHQRFEMTFALALFHHLLLQGLPLEEILCFISKTTRRFAMIEYVGDNDPQVKEGLAFGRQALQYPSRTHFVEACEKLFRINETSRLAGMDREIFLLERV